MCVCLSTHLLDWRTLPSLVYLISSAPLPMHVRQVWKLAQSAAWLAYLLPTSAQAYVTHVKVTAVGAVSRRAFQPVIYKTWRTFLLSSFQFLGFGGRVFRRRGIQLIIIKFWLFIRPRLSSDIASFGEALKDIPKQNRNSRFWHFTFELVCLAGRGR